MREYLLGIVLGIIVLNIVYANIVMWEGGRKNG